MRALLSCCILCTVLPVLGQETLKEISWQALARDGEIKAGTLMGDSLQLVNETRQPETFSLLSVSTPGISSPSYAISGEVRYEGVEQSGYLEMRNHFPGGKSYFTRTLAPSGPLQTIQGDSEWRPFRLPFQVRDASGWLDDRPERLDLNLVLQGRGTVFIRAVKLVQNAGGGPAGKTSGAWWSRKVGNRLGAAMGVFIGILGGVIGWAGGKGKARGVVMSCLWCLLAVGLLSLGAGIAALTLRQPYMVYYPLLLLGVICAAISTVRIKAFRKRYEQAELRRMSALDA